MTKTSCAILLSLALLSLSWIFGGHCCDFHSHFFCPKLEEGIGRANIELIQNPFRVYVSAVDPQAQDAEHPVHYLKIGKERSLSKEQIKALQELLLNDKHYDFEKEGLCPSFEPDLVFVFVGYHNQELFLYSSFSCKQIHYIVEDSPKAFNSQPMIEKLQRHFYKFLFILNHN